MVHVCTRYYITMCFPFSFVQSGIEVLPNPECGKVVKDICRTWEKAGARMVSADILVPPVKPKKISGASGPRRKKDENFLFQGVPE